MTPPVMAIPRRQSTVIAGVLLLPLLHPFLIPIVGVPSHLLWFAHVLPVSMVAHRDGLRPGILTAALSLLMIGAGEALLGAGYWESADPATTGALVVAVGLVHVLVGGFALRVRHEHGRRAVAEAALAEARRLEAVGRMASGIAHDFNNVLTVVQGSVSLLLDDASADDPARPELEAIDDAAKRAAGLTRQLLTFGRRATTADTPIDLNESLRGLMPMVRRLVGGEVALQWSLRTPLDRIRIDPSQLEQVIVNLVVNARDAMTDGGSVEITTRDLVLASASDAASLPAGRYVELAVRDTGRGMDAETRARIFEPYFTTKAGRGGTGLGLATVFGVLRQAGGGITVETRPGAGSTFRALLPAYRAATG